MPIAPSNGLELYYEEEGSGEPLLLIMGLSAQYQWWSRNLVEALKAQGFRVIRFDNRDVGRSTRLDSLGQPNVRRIIAQRFTGRRINPPYALDDLAEDTIGLMDFMDLQRAHVMGASMGGMVAQRVALNHPGRVASLTLLFTNSGSLKDGVATPHTIRTLLKPPPVGRQATIDRLAEVGQVLNGSAYPYDEAYWRDLAERCWAHSDTPPGTARQMAAVLGSPTTGPRLHEIQHPTLVIHGSADPLVRPKGGVRLARAIRRSRLLFFNGMGHHVPPELRQTIALNVKTVAAAA